MQTLRDICVSVVIEHPRRSDLIVVLQPPSALKVSPIVLHNRAGGDAPDLKQTFDIASSPALKQVVGKSPKGRWTLVVEDRGRRRQVGSGTLRGFKLSLSF